MTTSNDALTDSAAPGKTHRVIFSNPESAKPVPAPDLAVASTVCRPPAFSSAN